jgi:uridine kinase
MERDVATLDNTERKKTLCIGVAGGTGSGKTTVAREIVRRVGHERIVNLNQDRYYHDLAHLDEIQRTHHNFDHPAAIEDSLLVEHLGLLKTNQPAMLPVYDFGHHVRLAEVEQTQPRPVILLEGILILAIPAVRDLLDVKIFVDTDADLRFIRRLQRDIAERQRTVESVVAQYQATVRPMHLEFVEPSKRWADVIIPEGGFNKVAVDLVISRILQMLQLKV